MSKNETNHVEPGPSKGGNNPPAGSARPDPPSGSGGTTMSAESEHAGERPPNPFYFREYRTTVKSGEACLRIQAPGGRVDPQSASDLREWLRLVLAQLDRDIDKEKLAAKLTEGE